MHIFIVEHNLRQKSKKYTIIEIAPDERWNVIYETNNLSSARIFLDTIGFEIIDYSRYRHNGSSYANFYDFNFTDYFF